MQTQSSTCMPRTKNSMHCVLHPTHRAPVYISSSKRCALNTRGVSGVGAIEKGKKRQNGRGELGAFCLCSIIQPVMPASRPSHPYPNYQPQAVPEHPQSHLHPPPPHHHPYQIPAHVAHPHPAQPQPYPASAPVTNASAGPSRLPIASERRLSRVLGHIAHLRKLDQESIDKRREKRHAYRHKEDEGQKAEVAQACVTCRKAKTKCLNRDGEPCARCAMAGEKCTYPPQKKRGRRTDTR